MMGELSSGSGLGALLIFEVVEQGIGDRLFGNRYLVSFHRGRQRRVPCCSDRRAAECRVMGLGRPDCHEIVRCAEPPRQRPMVPQDRVGDGHAGPVEVAVIEEAGAGAGDLLVVGVNTDASVRRLKGEQRPIVDQDDRAEIVAALRAVDYVALFDDDTPYELIQAVQPDVLVKGGDYDPEATNGPRYIVGSDIVRQRGGQVTVINLVPGRSTTELIRKIGGW